MEIIDLFSIKLEPVTRVQPNNNFSIHQLLEQFKVFVSAHRADKYHTSKKLEEILSRSAEMTGEQREEVVDLLWGMDPWRVHPGSMRRFFVASWPESVELFKEVMRSQDLDDLQWSLAARLALCDTALRGEKGADRRRLDMAKADLVSFAHDCLGNHELWVDEKAMGLRGFLEHCASGTVPENRPLEAPKPHEGPKDGDLEEEAPRGKKGGNPRRLPKPSRRRQRIPLEKYSNPERERPEPTPAPQPPPTPQPAPAPPPAPAPQPAPAPPPAEPEPPPAPAPAPAPQPPAATAPATWQGKVERILALRGEKMFEDKDQEGRFGVLLGAKEKGKEPPADKLEGINCFLDNLLLALTPPPAEEDWSIF